MIPVGSVAELVGEIDRADPTVLREARERVDRLAKPPGSLGRLEDLAVRLAGIAHRCPAPAADPACLIICAADHGVTAQGISRWPAEVTGAMVATFLAGGAAANAIAAAVGARLVVLDVGVLSPAPAHPLLIDARIRPGTGDLRTGAAMTRAEAERALLAGARAAAGAIAAGAAVIATGDMGIGNTTAAACLIAAMTGRPAADVTGEGAGADARQLAHKTAVVADALILHRPDPGDPLTVLATLGGLEHAALVGVILAGAAARRPVVLDGVSTNAAALVAVALAPASADHLIAGHRSTEPAASLALDHLGLDPLVDLGMRLGEGSGALLALPVLRAASGLLAGMTTLAEVAG